MNKKQKSITNVAKDLFYKHGFKRVSVEEICKTAKVSKMTFYKFYPNKIELAKSVYEMLIDKGISDFHKIIRENTSAEEKIKKILQLKLESTNNISSDFVYDFYSDTELGLKEFIEEKTKQVWKSVIADFEFAQKKGWFRKDISPSLIFILSQKLTGLMNDPEVIKLYDSPQSVIMALTDFFVYGIIPHK
ncbi:MAG: TetR/AcrR family transcriptional regulator [Bacteroidales bacterium]|nr:TetR/AcrR family transcriptional regulator [Bacteroidales bacterium]MDY0215645.1 TetR/AcrR family transcriptional regulator [Bacteroidales bacterium]